MSTIVTIPHQRIRSDSGDEGTIRGALVSRPDGQAYGRLAIASRDGARRYRAISGSAGSATTLSIQLEEVLTDPATVSLASLDIDIPTGDNDASVVLSRLSDGAELLRTSVRLDITSDQ